MAPVRAQADVVVDSSRYSTTRLRGELLRLFDVPVVFCYLIAQVADVLCQGVGDRYGTVMASGTAYGDHQHRLPFLLVQRQDEAQKIPELLQKLLRLPEGKYIVPHPLVTTRLRGELLRLFGGSRDAGKMQVSVVSFGFKHGLPLEADLVFDVRFMPNPFYIDAL